jgi:hypothetical protein
VFNRPGVEAALRAGETPVITQTVSAELSNVVARGPLKMPRFAGELGVVDDVMDIHTRINIRGQLEALRRGQPGLFGDGSIGATAINTGRPVITADENFAAVLRSMGVEVRVP